MSEELQDAEREELLERLGIYLPKDEEFREMLKREGMGYLIRKDVQESFTTEEMEKISKDVDKILAELAASPTGLSGNERIVTEVLHKEAELLNFSVKEVRFDLAEKGYALKGKITVSLSSDDMGKASKEAELVTQLILIKLARTQGLVSKVDVLCEKAVPSTAAKASLSLQEAATEIENYAKKLLGDDYIMVKKRFQRRFVSREDLLDACSEVQRVLNLFIDEETVKKFESKVTDILYQVEGD